MPSTVDKAAVEHIAATEHALLGLDHYTRRLETNPDFVALCVALKREQEALLRHLVGSVSDHLDVGALHALRGEIRGIQRVLDKPHQERHKNQENE